MLSSDEGPILFRNTMQIATGHLEDFRLDVRKAVEFVAEHGPQLMVDVFIDEERMLAYSYQLYRDSESILMHWQMSDPYIREVMAHCTVRQFDVYGEPDEAVLEGVRSMGDDGVPVTINPRFVGFARFLHA
ncbi:hypothetical protein MOQ72_31325 [Saccharopolyspora sp. K220]|uniref:hypothetical protein n=1 Tax=Saccharopolyspora soli TaxID=2926618 RepID=UPI001F577F20|nr:hypothetical protein [Saccharopolyspora soli]MCI2421935.1 hypothetical protein [Saccharopolyspora soli]